MVSGTHYPNFPSFARCEKKSGRGEAKQTVPSPLAGLFPGPVVTRGSLRFTPGYCLIIPSGFRSLVMQALIAKTHTGGDIV